ncbi:MAG: hypothetical protein IPP33_13200 [Flavobacteriales bacterium]|nr:hypothetical protein [Flavobacteriales bacterium]
MADELGMDSLCLDSPVIRYTYAAHETNDTVTAKEASVMVETQKTISIGALTVKNASGIASIGGANA